MSFRVHFLFTRIAMLLIGFSMGKGDFIVLAWLHAHWILLISDPKKSFRFYSFLCIPRTLTLTKKCILPRTTLYLVLTHRICWRILVWYLTSIDCMTLIVFACPKYRSIPAQAPTSDHSFTMSNLSIQYTNIRVVLQSGIFLSNKN